MSEELRKGEFSGSERRENFLEVKESEPTSRLSSGRV